MLDFETKLYTSTRAYTKEIQTNKFVFFSPDFLAWLNAAITAQNNNTVSPISFFIFLN